MSVRIALPTFHKGQNSAFWLHHANERVVIRCGRRWGKTKFGSGLACDRAALKHLPVGWFAPSYKLLSEAYNDISDMVEPVKRSSSKTEGVIHCRGGGRIDFWTLDNEEAGRSRHYKLVVIDEGAFTDNKTMMGTFEKSILPTLLDLSGQALVMSNTNGNDPENFLYRICNDAKFGFKEYHAPTEDNPLIPLRKKDEAEEEYAVRRMGIFAKLAADNHPLVFQQEYKADFVDWSGISFFEKGKLLVNDRPVEWPTICDSVFAVVDSASKVGTGNDGTAVVYFSFSKILGHPLVVLDWDYVQIEGALLEQWLPTVFENLEAMARACKARSGSVGVWIEDKDSGTILLQQAARKGLDAKRCPEKMTSAGKDGRAISMSGYVYRAMVKFSRQAYDKVTTFKGVTRNHLTSQVFGFRVADPLARHRADDLLDGFTYGVALALGDSQGV